MGEGYRLRIIIEGVPQPQLRPRATRVGSGIRMYDPKKTSDYKKYVTLTARQQCENNQFEGALSVSIDIYRPIQKSTSKKHRKLKNERIIRPTVKSDIDNYVKAILDSLNGVAYADDSQVVELKANKFYSDDPRVEIEIKKLLEVME